MLEPPNDMLHRSHISIAPSSKHGQSAAQHQDQTSEHNGWCSSHAQHPSLATINQSEGAYNLPVRTPTYSLAKRLYWPNM